MANLSIKTGTISRSMLAGNAPYIPTSFESIATIVATGGESVITFSSIPTGYSHLQLRCLGADTFSGSTAAGQSDMIFNNDSTSNYSQQRLYTDGTTVTAAGTATRTSLGTCVGVYWGSVTTLFSYSITDIFDYASTTKMKSVKGYAGTSENTSTIDFQFSYGTGLWRSTAAINRIDLPAVISGWRAGSRFALYGVK
jgi:hypothetical protein